MGSILYDFVADSFLLNDASIADNYSRFSDAELKAELARYRDYCLAKHTELYQEAFPDEGATSLVASAGTTSPVLLSRGALYLNRFVVSDPLFKMTAHESEASRTFGDFMLKRDKPAGVDREDLVNAAKYLKIIAPFVAADYVRVLPFSVAFEPPKQLPLRYSETQFRELLPPKLSEFLRSKARLKELVRADGRLLVMHDPPKGPCRGISIEFDGAADNGAYLYNLWETRASSISDDNKRFQLAMELPDTPPDKEQFDIWVEQSMNSAAADEFRRVQRSASAAAALRSLYLAPYPLAAELVDFPLQAEEGIESFVAAQALALEVPWIDGIDPATLMSVREQDGEAFTNFRTAFESKFRELRTITDADKLRTSAENAAHELLETQTALLGTKIQSLKRRLAIDSALATIAISAAVQTGGITVLAAIYAAASGAKVLNDYKTGVRENPSYFAFRLKREAKGG